MSEITDDIFAAGGLGTSGVAMGWAKSRGPPSSRGEGHSYKEEER